MARRASRSRPEDVLVATEWVAEHIGDDSLRIVEVDETIAPYAEAHIPGAIGLDWSEELKGRVDQGPDGGEAFAELVASRGISNDHTVVLYGDCDNWFAAYAYWCFLYYGHDKLKLVDGGRAKWLAEGRTTEAGAPRHPPATFEAKPPHKAIRAMRADVSDALERDLKLVDVRTAAEFSGELRALPGYEQLAPRGAGHIPGAVSAPWTLALQDDGTFKTAAELRRIYAEAGLLDADAPVAVYCLLGGRSAHTWFVLHELLGVDQVASYDGGWADWGADADAPVERGTRPTGG